MTKDEQDDADDIELTSDTKVTAKQRAANKRNAQKSTGPRTPAGKARSAKNAMTHGIYAGPTAVPAGEFAEDQADIDAFAQQVICGLEPRNKFEEILANRVAAAMIRAFRLDRLAAFQIATSGRLDYTDGAELAAAVSDRKPEIAAGKILSEAVAPISLLDARAGREIERSLATYRTARKLVSCYDDKDPD